MGDKTPIQKIAQAAMEAVEEYVCSAFEDSPVGDSPIEHIMFAALVAYNNYVQGHDWNIIRLDRGESFTDFMADPRDHRGFDTDSLLIGHQVEIGEYRADFTATIWNYVAKEFCTIVIECDGHAYHERTKEQAARDRGRDRYMQAKGFTVFRFTGSEIHNDPMACAEQVFSMLWNFYSPKVVP